MLDFAFYNIKIRRANQLVMNPKKDVVDLNEAQKYLGMLFCERNELWAEKVTAKKGAEKITNMVLACKNNTYLWRVHNIERMNPTQENGTDSNGFPKYEKQEIKSQPFAYVVIDNTPGRPSLLIEKGSAWNGRTEGLLKVAESAINKQLRENFNLEADFVPVMIPTRTWDFCRKLTHNGNDKLKSITIEVHNPKQYAPKSLGQPVPVPDVIRSQRDYLEKTEAIKSMFMVEYNNCDMKRLEQETEDVVNIVRTCAQNDYGLSFRFDKFGTYKCDENVLAIYKLADGHVDDFKNGQAEMDGSYRLKSWIDECFTNIESLQNGSQTE